MAFPEDPLDAQVEIHFPDGWHTAGTFVDPGRLHPGPIVITWGKQDEASDVAPCQFGFTLDNADGHLTPCDPRSPYWPYWDLGTPVRVKVEGTVLAWGEISEILPRWPVDGAAADQAVVEVTVNGILRRLDQREKPLRSSIFRAVTSPFYLPHVSDYFPMEDGSAATQIASGIPGATLRTLAFTGLQPASDSTLEGSEALPTVGSGERADWTSHGLVGFNATGVIEVVGIRFPDRPDTADCIFRPIDLHSTGDNARWIVELRFLDDVPVMRVRAFNSAGTQTHISTADLSGSAIWFTDKPIQLRFEMNDSGGSVAWTATWWSITHDTDPGEGFGDTFAGSMGTINRYGGLIDQTPGCTMGQVIVHDGILPGWLVGPDVGWWGEASKTRTIRLCGELGYPLQTVVGDDLRSMPMGPQRALPPLELLKECASADVAMFGESRNAFGLRNQPRRARYNLVTTLTLDASNSEIVSPFEPTRDDQVNLNDVTAQRLNGTSANVFDQASIVRHGLYDDSITENVATDVWVRHIAGWHMHLGMVKGLRYADITMDLAVAEELIPTWKEMNRGDRITVTDLPIQHPTGPVDLVLEGATETLTLTGWVVNIHCSSYDPWRVGTWVNDRWSSRDSHLSAPVGSADGTLFVATPGRLWTTNPAHFPIDVILGIDGIGELITVNAITGASSPQTWSVTRNVNGLGRSWAAGTALTLAVPAVLGL